MSDLVCFLTLLCLRVGECAVVAVRMCLLCQRSLRCLGKLSTVYVSEFDFQATGKVTASSLVVLSLIR